MSILKFKDIDESSTVANKNILRPRRRRLDPDITKAHAIADGVRAGTSGSIATRLRRRRPLWRIQTIGIGRELGRIRPQANYTEVKNRHHQTMIASRASEGTIHLSRAARIVPLCIAARTANQPSLRTRGQVLR